MVSDDAPFTPTRSDGPALPPVHHPRRWTAPDGFGLPGAVDTAAADTDLVARAVDGDRDAFGALYDRYADRIYDLCVHMLRDSHEAADACAEVFLVAAEHLGRLRDPAKLKSWLYAITRNEVYRRSRRRQREQPVDTTDERVVAMSAPVVDDVSDPAAMVDLVREAARGLDERDQLVLELTLAGELDGDALGDALGLSTDAAYQATHRMRERLGRSVGALLVARQGKADCDELSKVLATWDGTFSVLWRKRVARHVDNCEVCERRRRAVPASVLGGSAFAAMVPVRFVSAPPATRERVMDHARLGAAGSGSGRGWRSDGFPMAASSRRRLVIVAVSAAAIVLLTVGTLAVASSGGTTKPAESIAGTTGDGPASSDAIVTTVESAAGVTTPPTTSSARVPDSSTTRAGTKTAPSSAGSSTPNATTTTAMTTTTTTKSTTTTKPATTTSPTTTTTAPDTTGPTLSVSVPAALITRADRGCPVNPQLVATVSDPSGVVSVSMHFTGAATGTLFFTKVSDTSWTRDWTPPADGSYTVVISATDGRNNLSTATRTVSAGPCIG